MLTRDELTAVMPRAARDAERLAEPLGAAMARFEINRPTRKAAFLAQLAHESGELQHWKENLNYSWQGLRKVFPKYFRSDAEARAFDRQPERIANRVYGGRMGNRPEASGDGWRYRGRGPIQLTGRDNYRACGAAIGVDLLSEPARLESADAGCMAAAWFWATRGLNELADEGDFVAITRRINGGLIGLPEREKLWARAREAFGLPAPEPAAVAPRTRALAEPRPARAVGPPAAGARPRRRPAARSKGAVAARKRRPAARAFAAKRRGSAGATRSRHASARGQRRGAAGATRSRPALASGQRRGAAGATRSRPAPARRTRRGAAGATRSRPASVRGQRRGAAGATRSRPGTGNWTRRGASGPTRSRPRPAKGRARAKPKGRRAARRRPPRARRP
ncbi:MAG TPA: glycoside hydrolase family 19 protein [Candidatus Binatia bacterium]|nr:glycoside hydrolase family 19 protein [Candidatus Binatia bacterium]